jgi:hypothetical protein
MYLVHGYRVLRITSYSGVNRWHRYEVGVAGYYLLYLKLLLSYTKCVLLSSK